ncbi:MAG: hypothetical protein WDZ68_02205 [Candidatus Paceibacterota bacterium]
MSVAVKKRMRYISFIVIAISSIFVTPWILAPLVVLYALHWRAYELLIVAACIDAYFGVASSIPYYTVSVLMILIVMEWVKPSLLFNNQ